MDILKGKINKEIPVPLYYQLKEIILNEIISSKLKPGDLLPTEAQFMASYNISRSTVRQAILELVNEDYLARQKGKGTYVIYPKIKQSYINKVQTYEEQMKSLDIEPRTKVEEFKVVFPTPKVSNKLGLLGNAKVIKLARLRFANEEPIVIVETYMPYNDCQFLMEYDMGKQSLYEALAKEGRTNIVKATRVIEAQLANEYEAEVLQIEEGDALQVITTVGVNKDNIPMEYTIAKYRADRNKFTIETHLKGEDYE